MAASEYVRSAFLASLMRAPRAGVPLGGAAPGALGGTVGEQSKLEAKRRACLVLINAWMAGMSEGERSRLWLWPEIVAALAEGLPPKTGSPALAQALAQAGWSGRRRRKPDGSGAHERVWSMGGGRS